LSSVVKPANAAGMAALPDAAGESAAPWADGAVCIAPYSPAWRRRSSKAGKAFPWQA
jgi:hypothetical protein